jgi:beta-glucosidase
LSFYDDTKQAWIIEPGKFEAIVAASAADIKSKVVFNVE